MHFDEAEIRIGRFLPECAVVGMTETWEKLRQLAPSIS
jgi:hypothetical protein